MGLPTDLLLLTPEEATRRIGLRQLKDAAGALERLADPADADALHDFRVAIRRLRSTLRAWRAELDPSVRKKQRRGLAGIQAATSASRDAQVALLWLQEQSGELRPVQRSGLAWIVGRLEAQRASARAQALEQARDAFEKLHEPLRARLALLRTEVDLTRPAAPARFGAALAARLREHSLELVERLAAVATLDCRTEAHAARIRLKRLRYLIDSTAERLEDPEPAQALCKRLQDLLGQLNDAHVLRAMLLEALEHTALAPASATLRRPSAAAFERRRRPREHAGLLELRRRATERSESLFSTLERDWLGDGAAALVAAVERVAESAATAARGTLEIERKYLLRGRPQLPAGTPVQDIDQGWLPGKLLRERLRRVRTPKAVRYLRTIKFGQGLQRIEVEEPTSARVFELLWPLTEGRRVSKLRHAVHEAGRIWEIDEFQDRELWLAEVELPDVDAPAEAPAWLAPWIVREVTDEAGFTNYELAR